MKKRTYAVASNWEMNNDYNYEEYKDFKSALKGYAAEKNLAEIELTNRGLQEKRAILVELIELTNLEYAPFKVVYSKKITR